MRCRACDKILNDYELTKKFSVSHQFVDLCNECCRYLSENEVFAEGNINFASLSDLEEENVQDGSVDYFTARDYGDDGEW